ncbi:MAG: ATP-binding protein [Candidatus Acidiferrales bacterium]
MEHASASIERVIGRDAEMRRLRTALRKRESQLLWGPSGTGKTLLIKKTLAELPDAERRRCIFWSGPAVRRQLVEHLIRGLYFAGDPLVRKRVDADRYSEANLSRWINEQSAPRLKGILIAAIQQREYRFFLDHLPPASHTIAQLLKEIMYRTKTPVYLTGHGYTQADIGYAWSLYWTDEYRIQLGPLSERAARELLELCIRSFDLASLELNGFREDVLRLSGRLPGSIVKMCEMAADPRYHYGDQVKVKLVHVDYLLQGDRFTTDSSHHS